MGRLTLNVLLSFAQFEREVTGERIRDKIAASKRKGMWMGGPVPIGYDVINRKLVINAAEAELVRLIFKHYLNSASLEELTEDLAKLGVRSKQRMTRDGRPFGGTPFRPGGLRHILGNRIYLGEVNHKGQVHPGEHVAIIDLALWKKVQARLSEAVKRPRTGTISALTGRICDADGSVFTAPTATRAASATAITSAAPATIAMAGACLLAMSRRSSSSHSQPSFATLTGLVQSSAGLA